MRGRPLLVIVAVVFGLVLVWWLFVFAPRGRELSDTRTQREEAERTQQGLEATVKRLEEIDANGPKVDAELARLTDAVPANPDLAGFIVSANEIKVQSGIDWLSVAPTEPATAVGGPPAIRLSIQIEGGFFQVLDYLNRLEDLERLVVVDSLNITAAVTSEAGAGRGFSTSGAPTLQATLTGRMFTQAAAAQTGATPAAPVAPTVAPTGVAPTETVS